MRIHDEVDLEVRDLASFYALGVMGQAEAKAYEAHLRECVTCAREAAALRETAGAIGLSAPEAEPREGLRDELMARVRAEPQAAPPALDGFDFVPADDGSWEDTGLAGVGVRKLHVDVATKRMTCLLRVDAGARFPAHEHGGEEECYVLRGDMRFGGRVFRPGDYVRALAGTTHPEITTEEGCVCLLLCSTENRFLA